MKIHEDRSHMNNIDTRWFEKGYAKEDVHSPTPAVSMHRSRGSSKQTVL